ncbi:anti-sigma factor RsbA family regulatory protein [Nonomuraea aurantiaca]|jgi:anti-sigma regulatory factor (Ser/Thr protein kinase)|uniref:anti-sigma factor RsbA family regulatory protein n=1 Tax=Nonomuraea aurantiaca TaxID=2878562 RepID=UPI001CD9C529|nr:anti-sigma factor RsbA family regulatory protein [Nonomuraea aurantiaca]MCA2223264.1 MEDS domain-containing protein [Nonomuraea aurantiaca]
MVADPFVHPALFYRGDREYVAATTAFIREGLSSGEPVAVAVPPRNLALIEAGLGRDADEVLLLDMTSAGRNPGRIIPAVLREFADRHPVGHVRIIGEPIWPGRTVTEYPACAQHEALINYAFTGRHVTILCPYDLDGLDPEVIREAEQTHPVLRDGSGEWLSGDYAPQKVVDGHNQPLDEPADFFSLRFDHTNLAAARGLAAGRAAELGFSRSRLDDIRLTVAELGANSLDHGGGSGLIRVWAEADRLVCEVSDSGHILDPLAGRMPVDPRTPGSRGLLIVNLLSDLVRVHTRAGATVIRAYFDLPGPRLHP